MQADLTSSKMDPSPTIAIVGRPNVGKSTIFNRLIGKKQAIVSPIAGTTRDRIAQQFECNGYNCILIDTGGLDTDAQENIEENVQAQAKLAIAEADLIIFVVDNNQELNADDFSAADILRKSKKPIILISNKADFSNLENQAYNFFELGFGAPIQISAIHKLGIETLNDEIAKNLKELSFSKETTKKKSPESKTINICVLGQPNAGKSSLVNSLFGSEKIIVSDIPGTTRDTIDTEVIYEGTEFNLIDTAGLRKPGKIKAKLDKFSSFRAINAIERSDVAILLIDGTKGIGHQDCHIAQFALEQKKGLILVINKIDLLAKGEEAKDQLIHKLRQKFAFVPWAPVLFISGKNKKNIFKIFELAREIVAERSKRISTSALNTFLQKTTHKHVPSSNKPRRPKFMYASQVSTDPPYFVLFFKNARSLHFSYPRYLENELRKEYSFNGTAIELKLKESISNKKKST